MKKKVISMLLLVCMVLTLLPATALAVDGNTAQSLVTALNGQKGDGSDIAKVEEDGVTVTLLRDATLASGTFTVGDGVILNGGSSQFTLSLQASTYGEVALNAEGNATIRNVKIENKTAPNSSGGGSYAISVNQAGTNLHLENVILNPALEGDTASTDPSRYNYGINVSDAANGTEVTLTNTTVYGYVAVRASSGCAVNMDESSKLVAKSPTNWVASVVQANSTSGSATVTVSGGTILASGKQADAVYPVTNTESAQSIVVLKNVKVEDNYIDTEAGTNGSLGCVVDAYILGEDGSRTYQYADLADVVENAADGASVVLTDSLQAYATSYGESKEISVDKNLNIDLNGVSLKTISVAQGKTLNVSNSGENEVSFSVGESSAGYIFVGEGNFAESMETNKLPGAVIPTVSEAADNSLLEKNASNLMTEVTLAKNASDGNTYALAGTVNYVEGWTEFNGAVEEEQSGHYVALQLAKPENCPESFEVTITGSGEGKKLNAFFTEGENTYETVIVRLDNLRVAAEEGTEPKNEFTVAFDWTPGNASDEVVTYTFDISQLVFEVPEVKAPETSVNGGVASSTVEDTDITASLDAIVANKDVEGAPEEIPTLEIPAGEVSGEAAKAEVKITSAGMTAIANALEEVGELTVSVETHNGKVVINPAVIQKLAETSGDVTLNVKKSEADATTELPDAAPTPVGGSEIYDVSFTDGSDEEIAITEDDSHAITLTLTFTTASTEGLTIGWVSGEESGKLSTDDVEFSAVANDGGYNATFTIDHLTSFYLTEANVEPPVEPELTATVTKDDTNDLAPFKVAVTGLTESTVCTVQVRPANGNPFGNTVIYYAEADDSGNLEVNVNAGVIVTVFEGKITKSADLGSANNTGDVTVNDAAVAG